MTDSEFQTLIPPRFWWLKRLSAAYAILILTFALLYVGWVQLSHRRLAAAIGDVQRRGEPVLPQDFDPPPVPADRNAAVMLNEAAKRFAADEDWTRDLSQSGQDAVRYDRLAQLSDPDLQAVEKLIARHQETLRLIHEAGRCNADWGIRLRPQIISVLLPHLNPQRQLATLVAVAALHDHARGDDMQALERCRDLFRHGERVGDNPSMDITYLAGLGSVYRAVDVIAVIAPKLELSDPRRRELAQQLIEELLDERPTRQAWLRARQSHRPFITDAFHSHIEGKGWTIEPLFRLDTARALRSRDAYVAAGRCETYPEAWAIVQQTLPPWQNVNTSTIPQWRRGFVRAYPPRFVRQATLLSSMIWPLQSNLRTHYQCLLARRAAATLLAVRMFQLDHDSLPTRWDDLVPAYLPAIPSDPFGSPGAMLRLIRRADDVAIYSVGIDQVDNNGAEMNTRGYLMRGAQRFNATDYVYQFPDYSEDAQEHERQ